MSLPEEKFYVIKEASHALSQLFFIVGSVISEKDTYGAAIQALIPAIREMILAEHGTALPDKRLKAVYDAISESYSDAHFDLHSLILTSGYSEDHFRCLYKKAYGLTPKEYLDKLRMENALYLLNNYRKTLKIQEIAAMCGYIDALYFSRKFKKYTGTSPENYKRGHSYETD